MMMLDRSAGKEGRTIITSSTGSAFLSEHSLGTGKIIFYSVAPTLAWSDFPLKGLFAPLLYRSVVYAALPSEHTTAYIVGDAPTLSLPEGQLFTDGQYNLVGPDGIEELVRPAAQSASTRAAGTSLALPQKVLTQLGIYMVKHDAAVVSEVAVNIDGNEADTRIISAEDLIKFWKRLGIAPSSVLTTTQGDQLQAAILQSRFGVELWKYCIGIALLLTLLEMMIARDSRKKTEQAIGA